MEDRNLAPPGLEPDDAAAHGGRSTDLRIGGGPRCTREQRDRDQGGGEGAHAGFG